MLSPPTGIHDSVGDQALRGEHPAEWLLRLSPSVDAAAKTPNHRDVSLPKSKVKFSGSFFGFDTYVPWAYITRGTLGFHG